MKKNILKDVNLPDCELRKFVKNEFYKSKLCLLIMLILKLKNSLE